MIYTAIVACEVAFWVFLGAGLATRYLLHRPRTSVVLLLGSPAADLLLLLFVAVDLAGGGTPTQGHALAALYLGFSVAFGQSAVRWADRWFAHRFAGGPPAATQRRDVYQQIDHEWRAFRKAVLGWAVACTLLFAMSALTGDLDRAETLLGYAGMLTIGLVIWFVVGPVRAALSVPHMLSRDGHHMNTQIPPMEPLPDVCNASSGTRTGPPPRPATPMRRWAPWWVYLGVILGANYLRQLLMPADTVPEWTVVLIVVGLSATLFLASTAIYRATIRR